MRWSKLVLLPVAGALAVFALSPSTASAADLDCADFSNQAEAQENLLPGDPYRLDADNDNIACEDLPCPCAGEGNPGGPIEPPLPPPPPKLDKGAARNAAMAKAQAFVGNNPSVDSISFQGCNRRSRHRIDCRFQARGSTTSLRTTCRLRVVVRGEGESASASLAHPRCDSEAIAILRYSRARQAMQTEANRTAGREATLFAIERIDALAFEGSAEWTQRTSIGTIKACSVELTVQLLPSTELRIRTSSLTCQSL